MTNIFPPGKHTDFVVSYTVSWDPRRVCAMSVHVDPGMTMDEAARIVAKLTNQQTGKKRWIVCDDGLLIRPDDVVAAQVVVAATVAAAEDPRPPFGFTLGSDDA